MDSSIVRLFEQVQGIPYKVCKYDESEINLEIRGGDCRHKSFLLKRLLEERELKVRFVTVIFDWKDLPIPAELLGVLEKSGTVWPHKIIEVKIGKRWIKVDCSWDPKLKGSGFPVTEDWDGKSNTKQITESKLRFYSPEEYENKHKIKIVNEEAHSFASKFNHFLEECREK